VIRSICPWISVGAELVRLETAVGEPDGIVHLRAAGALGALRNLLRALESDLSSPARIRDVRLESARARDGYALEVMFVLREPAPNLATAVAGEQAGR